MEGASTANVAQLKKTSTVEVQLDGKYTIQKHPSITAPRGFRAGGVHCGIKHKRLDLGLIVCDVPAVAAAVYTTNTFQAAPLKVTKAALAVEGKLQAMVVNSGNANACTGIQGEQDARVMQAETAKLLAVPAHYVGVISTGVIGEPLPVDKIKSGLGHVHPISEATGADAFCEAILTTDTYTKKVEVALEIDGKVVHIAGAAKGSGMIKPNMATMLGFVTTDAAIEPSGLQNLLKTTTNTTYNMITVDGDTSTNDMVVVMASGLAGNNVLNEAHPAWASFAAAFHYLNETLAKLIARDGEGATKMIEARVRGAHTVAMARHAAKAIIGSNLVKTAVFGADANWGRIICALGYSDVPVNPDNIAITIGGIPVVEQSLPVLFNEEEVSQAMRLDPVVIEVDLHQGDKAATAWGCDLTYGYVRINASYRT